MIVYIISSFRKENNWIKGFFFGDNQIDRSQKINSINIKLNFSTSKMKRACKYRNTGPRILGLYRLAMAPFSMWIGMEAVIKNVEEELQLQQLFSFSNRSLLPIHTTQHTTPHHTQEELAYVGVKQTHIFPNKKWSTPFFSL